MRATAFAAAAVFITSLIYHISIEETPLLLTALVGGSVFLVSFTVFFLLRYPTKKRIAAKLDTLGLKERATTMLAYQHVDTEIARLQRQLRDEVQVGTIRAIFNPMTLFGVLALLLMFIDIAIRKLRWKDIRNYFISHK